MDNRVKDQPDQRSLSSIIQGTQEVEPTDAEDLKDLVEESTIPGVDRVGQWVDGWGRRRAKSNKDDKDRIGRDFARHDFLVQEGSSPEGDRESVATILANQGTTSNIVAKWSLEWIRENAGGMGPFDLTWYTTGALLPTTLRNFRVEYPQLKTAAQLFLFPGRVDPDLEAVEGPEAVGFAKQLQRDRSFTFAYLSAHSFDIATGVARFHFSREVELQSALAKIFAAHKFLFANSRKLRHPEGMVGYTVYDLLETSETVTIYSTCSNDDERLIGEFRALASSLLDDVHEGNAWGNSRVSGEKGLRLRLVGDPPIQVPLFGTLKRKG